MTVQTKWHADSERSSRRIARWECGVQLKGRFAAEDADPCPTWKLERSDVLAVA
jgi:hypothetical protein